MSPPPADRFASFWMAGFEGADHVNLHGQPLDMAAVTGHGAQLALDYALCSGMGLRTVRESLGWRLCAPVTARRADFSRLRRMAEAAARQGVQQIWTLMHYGTPPDVRVMDADFAERFADFAAAAARRLRACTGGPSIYNPINEIGFLAWALAAQRILGGTCDERDGYAVKLALVRAALLGTQAIRAEDPGARFIAIEPLIHVVSAPDRPDRAPAAQAFSAYQWQVWDLLLGRSEPQLGGSRAAVDWIGVNHYHDAQWDLDTGAALAWQPADPRRTPFAALLGEAWARYRLPLVVAETSHCGAARAPWLDEIAGQTARARAAGVVIEGLCLYPIVDRPDWNDLRHWHRSGLWDAIAPAQASAAVRPRPTARRLAADYAQALARWRSRLPG